MSSGSYKQLLERLFNSRRAGVVLGLERVERCLAALGHPERQAAVRVHIGGTNGKGSTAAFVDAIAREHGRRTGLFTSPHLTRFAERFRIDGQPAGEQAIIAAADELARPGTGYDELTFFEQVTVMGLWLFARAGVEVAILEVGLGGRLDATNAVVAEVACVTGVALEHQDYLGSTLAAIAAEKSGIFKPLQRAVIGRAGEPEAVPMLAAMARARGVAELTVVDAPVPADWPLGLAGAHQRDNAAAALAIVDHLEALGQLCASPEQRRRGLERARMPGRLETLAWSPRIIIDGAHNPHAARMLAQAMADLPERPVLVLAVSADKDVAGIVGPLAGGARALVVTRYSQARSMPVADLDELCARVAPDVPRVMAGDVATALAMAVATAVDRPRDLAGSAGIVLATGSLFLAGEVRQLLCGDRGDPVLLSDPVGNAAAAPRLCEHDGLAEPLGCKVAEHQA